MNILYYSPHPHLKLQSPSGYGTHMREMIQAFEEKGCHVLPVIMGDKGSNKNEKSTKSTTVTSLVKKIAGKRIWRTLRDINLIRFDKRAKQKLEKRIASFNPDLIYERANYLQLSGINIANKMNIPHVLEVNSPYVYETDYLSDTKSHLYWLINQREKKQFKNAGQIVTVSDTLKRYFINKYEVKESKFLTLPNAFNNESITLGENRQRKIISKYNLSGNTVIGFVGSIFEWHRVDLLIKAFDKLPYANTKLLIVGYGEYLNELKNIASECDRTSDIIFTDKVPRDQVFNYINIMDICTAPGSAWYQSPIKLFEYGALGKPIIAPDTKPVNEIMRDEVDGYLVKPKVQDLHRCLKNMIEKKDKAEEMGRKFQKKVLNKYTWEVNAQAVLDLVGY